MCLAHRIDALQYIFRVLLKPRVQGETFGWLFGVVVEFEAQHGVGQGVLGVGD